MDHSRGFSVQSLRLMILYTSSWHHLVIPSHHHSLTPPPKSYRWGSERVGWCVIKMYTGLWSISLMVLITQSWHSFIMSIIMIVYSRRHKNGDVSVPFHSVPLKRNVSSAVCRFITSTPPVYFCSVSVPFRMQYERGSTPRPCPLITRCKKILVESRTF